MAEAEAHIGRFMVAVGAIIVHQQTGKILLTKRAATGHHDNEWELMYGRIDQSEELSDAIKREVFEETGLTDITMEKLLRIWHIYRGEKIAEKEIYGFTFVCSTHTDEIKLSREHTKYLWATVEQALSLIEVPGIKQDIELFEKYQKNKNVQAIISDTKDEIYFRN